MQHGDGAHRKKNRLPRPVGILLDDPVRARKGDGCHRDIQRVLHGYPGVDGREGVPEGEEGESADDQRIKFDLRSLIPATPREDHGGKQHQPQNPEPDGGLPVSMTAMRRRKKRKKKATYAAAFFLRCDYEPIYEITSSGNVKRFFLLVDAPRVDYSVGVDVSDRCGGECRGTTSTADAAGTQGAPGPHYGLATESYRIRCTIEIRVANWCPNRRPCNLVKVVPVKF